MCEESRTNGLCQMNSVARVACSDAISEGSQQRFSRVGKEVLPLSQLLERSKGCGLLFFFFGGFSACDALPLTCCLKQRAPAVESSFGNGKELIDSGCCYFC